MEQLGEGLQRLAEASTQAAGFESSPDQEFTSIIAQTLRNLSEGTENIQVWYSKTLKDFYRIIITQNLLYRI